MTHQSIINTPGRALLDRIAATPRQPINPEQLAKTILRQLPGERGKPMSKIFTLIVAVIMMLAAVIMAAEDRGGTGEQKKDFALWVFKEGVKQLPLPPFLTNILVQDAFVGPIINVLVLAFNSIGIFFKPNDQSPAPSPG